MRIILIVLIFFTINQKVSAVYEVTENCRNAWMLLMDLEIEDAKDLLAEEIKINPDNYYAYYLDQTCDAFDLLINSGDDAYEAFMENYEKKRIIMDDKDKDSPYYLSCDAEMDLQVGIFRIINGYRFSGLRKAFSAYKNTYRNLQKYPEFKPSLKLDGFFNIAVSNLPPFVKWAVSTFGVSSDADYGFEVLRNNYKLQKHIEGLNAEAALYIILSAKLNKTPEIVYEFVNSLDSNISKTFLHTYFRANIAFRTGKNEEAFNSLNQIDIKTKPKGDIIYSYLMAKILLHKLDFNAGYYFDRYLSYFHKQEYLKEMNYKLGLHYLLNNDKQKFDKHKEITLEEGNDINERDREVLYDAKLDYIPDIELLKAHLLLDGGYFKRYCAAIKTYEAKNRTFLAYRLEYHFLEGKYNEASNNNKFAIEHFKKVIELGSDEDYYFASESALHLGSIYEKLKQNANARKYYDKSLDLYENDYYEYIEDKANKALRLLKIKVQS